MSDSCNAPKIFEACPEQGERNNVETGGDSMTDELDEETLASTFIARMVLHQIAVDEFESKHLEERSEDEEEEDQNRHRNNYSQSKPEGDLDIIKQVWDDFVSSNNSFCAGELHLPDELFLDATCINYLNTRMRRLSEADRPVKFILASEVDPDSAERLSIFIKLFKSTLREIILQRKRNGILHCQEHVYNRILCRTLNFNKLVSVSIKRILLSAVATDCLSKTLSSPECLINSLSLTETQIQNFDNLSDALELYAGLEKLDLAGCELGDEQFSTLAHALERSPSRLTHVNLCSNSLTGASLSAVACVLRGQNLLLVLNLSRNPLFEEFSLETMTAFQEAMAQHHSLQDLRLNCCGLKPTTTMHPLLTALAQNTSLLFVQIAGTLGETVGEETWADSLPRMKRFRSKLIPDCWTQVPTYDSSSSLSDSSSSISVETATAAAAASDWAHSEDKKELDELLDGLAMPLLNLDIDTLRVLSHDKLLCQISIYLDPPPPAQSPKSSTFKSAWNRLVPRHA
ncbi:hypothetical protein ACA910_014524 [Epithemia clementina (nom. ined.)]